jgi:hypothetical protein
MHEVKRFNNLSRVETELFLKNVRAMELHDLYMLFSRINPEVDNTTAMGLHETILYFSGVNCEIRNSKAE